MGLFCLLENSQDFVLGFYVAAWFLGLPHLRHCSLSGGCGWQNHRLGEPPFHWSSTCAYHMFPTAQNNICRAECEAQSRCRGSGCRGVEETSTGVQSQPAYPSLDPCQSRTVCMQSPPITNWATVSAAASGLWFEWAPKVSAHISLHPSPRCLCTVP